MSQLSRQNVICALEELANREEQCRLWLSNGSSGEVGSFEEAICEIFDAGSTKELDSGAVEEPFYSLFSKLQKLAAKIPANASPKDVIEHPVMSEIRTISAQLLEKLRSIV